MSETWLQIFIAVFGIFGNLLSIWILGNKHVLIRKFNWYLLLQSTGDLIFLVMNLANLIIEIVYTKPSLMDFIPNKKGFKDLSWTTCKLNDYIFETLNDFGILLTLVLSIDRLYAVLKPLKIKLFVTNLYPNRVALTLWVVVMVLLVPSLFINENPYNTLTKECVPGIPSNSIKLIIYNDIILPLILVIIPALASIVLNILLWLKVHDYSQNREITHGSEIDVAKVTPRNSYHLILIIMNIMDLPYYIEKLRSVFLVLQEQKVEEKSNITNILLLTGHSINILTFLFFHREFRVVCKSLNFGQSFWGGRNKYAKKEQLSNEEIDAHTVLN